MSVYTSMARYAEQSGGRALNKNNVSGSCGGYTYMMYVGGDVVDNLLRVAFATAKVTDEAKTALTDYMRQKETRDRLHVQSVGFSHEGHRIVFTFTSDIGASDAAAFAQVVNRTLDELTALLAQNGIKPGCSQCGDEGDFPLAHVGDMYIPMCEACFEKGVVEAKNHPDRDRYKGNYFTGAIGALLGAILGIAAFVIVARFGDIAAVTGIVTAILTAKGYSLMRGRVGYGMPLIVFVCILLAVWAGVLVDNSISIMQTFGELGLKIGFFDAMNYSAAMFFRPELEAVGRMWLDCLMPALFGIVGGLPLMITMVRNSKSYSRIPERV